jgi:hypothetical protein
MPFEFEVVLSNDEAPTQPKPGPIL